MTTALVLFGGASLGAIQVGMLQALTERGIRPDLLVGTSDGGELRRERIFPLRPLDGILGLMGQRSHDPERL